MGAGAPIASLLVTRTTRIAMPNSPKTPPGDTSPGAAPQPVARPARRRTDARSPGERRGTLRELDDRTAANDDNALESLGKAMSSPVIEAADEDEKKQPR
jgi:hypothetical protein